MTGTKRTARNISTNWLMLALNVGISFFLSPFVVNKLGSTYYGIWALSMQFTGYLYLLDFGVRESVIRYTSKYVTRSQGRQLNHVISTAFMLYVPITLGAIALTLGCAWALPTWFDIPSTHVTEARLAVFFVGLTIAQTFFFNVFTGILQGLNRFDIANTAGMIITVVRTVLIVLLLMMGHKLVALAAIQFAMAIVGGLITAVAAVYLLRKNGLPLKFAIPRGKRFVATRRKVFGYGVHVLINNVAQKINFASDAVVIAIFLPVAAVTPYAIAGSLVDYLRSLVISTAQIFSPLSSQLHTQRRPHDLALLLIRGAKLTVLVVLPVSITFAVLGSHFVALWMGEEYRESAGSVLLVLGLTQILSAPHYVVSSVLYGMSKHAAMGRLRVGEAAVNLVLSIILVQSMGILGVALGTAISHSIVVVALLPLLVIRLVPLTLAQYFVGAYSRPLLAALPFSLGTLVTRAYFPAAGLLEFFAQMAVLTGIYVVCVYLIALHGDEREMIHRLLGRKAAKAPA